LVAVRLPTSAPGLGCAAHAFAPDLPVADGRALRFAARRQQRSLRSWRWAASERRGAWAVSRSAARLRRSEYECDYPPAFFTNRGPGGSGVCRQQRSGRCAACRHGGASRRAALKRNPRLSPIWHYEHPRRGSGNGQGPPRGAHTPAVARAVGCSRARAAASPHEARAGGSVADGGSGSTAV
jgi:hypothetical protein